MKGRKIALCLLAIAVILAITIPEMPLQMSEAKTTITSFSTKNKVKGTRIASKTQNQIKLKWSKMKGATGYQIYSSTSRKGKYMKISNTKKTSFIDTKLKAAKKYYYKIRAYKKENKSYKYSRFSSIFCAKTRKNDNSTTQIPATEKTTTQTTASEKTTAEALTAETSATEVTATEAASTQAVSEKTTAETPTTEIPTIEISTQYTQNLNYTESTARINNPDQGFYQHISIKVKESGINYDPSSIRDSDQLYHLRINIGDFSKKNNGTKDKKLTAPALVGIDKLLESLYKRNKNVIIRFSYDFDGNKDKEPELDMIIKHIKQIAPILNKYPDTITAVEFGLIGPWGEMHSSTMATKNNINKLIDTYLDNTSQLPILVRTPAVIYNYLGITIYDIDDYTIDSTSKAYRLGLYNDGYLGSDTDLNTYTNRTIEIPWLAKQTSHLPYGGEVVVPDSSLHNIENCIPEMQEIHLSYLNKSWNDTVIDKWKNTYYTAAIGNDSAYYDISAYEYIENHLGYRFVLENSVFEYSDSLSNIKIDLDIKNVGFGNLNRTKQMTLLLVDEQGNITSYDAGVFTGESQVSIQLPININAGDYNVYLRIDNGNGKYYIQFANDLWNDELNANQIGTISKKTD